MTRVAKASSESKGPSLTRRKEERQRRIATSMLIARPISSLSPWFSGCRPLAWKGWDRGRGNRLQGHIRSGHRRRHRKRCRRRDGSGTWLSFGIAQETGLITSVPFGEKENFADV